MERRASSVGLAQFDNQTSEPLRHLHGYIYYFIEVRQSNGLGSKCPIIEHGRRNRDEVYTVNNTIMHIL